MTTLQKGFQEEVISFVCNAVTLHTHKLLFFNRGTPRHVRKENSTAPEWGEASLWHTGHFPQFDLQKSSFLTQKIFAYSQGHQKDIAVPQRIKVGKQ